MPTEGSLLMWVGIIIFVAVTTETSIWMDKSIGILDKDYTLWVNELVKRYRGSQIKAAIKVNKELLRYYWELGKDIEEKTSRQ